MVVTLKLQHDKSVKTICAGNEMTLIWFAVGYLLCYRNLGKWYIQKHAHVITNNHSAMKISS